MLRILSILAILFVAHCAVADDERGTLTLRVRCPDIHPDVAAKEKSFVVNLQNDGLSDVVVYIATRPAADPDPSEAYEAKRVELVPAEMQFADGKITPQFMLMRTLQPLQLSNTGTGNVNAYFSPGRGNPSGNYLLEPGQSLRYPRFVRPLSVPCVIESSIHKGSIAYVLPLDHPYYRISDRNGLVTLVNLPVGDHELRFWHVELESIKEVQRDGKPWEDADNGKFPITIKPGKNDLGFVDVPFELFFNREKK